MVFFQQCRRARIIYRYVNFIFYNSDTIVWLLLFFSILFLDILFYEVWCEAWWLPTALHVVYEIVFDFIQKQQGALKMAIPFTSMIAKVW